MFRAKQVDCNQAVFVVVQSDSLAVSRSLVFNHSSSTLRDRGLGSVAGTGRRGGAPGAALPRHPPPPPHPPRSWLSRFPVCSGSASGVFRWRCIERPFLALGMDGY